MNRYIINGILFCAFFAVMITPVIADDGSHEEINPIGKTGKIKFGKITSLCLNAEGILLVCDAKSRTIKIITPMGKLKETWKTDFPVTALTPGNNGNIYIGGPGRLAILNGKGKLRKLAIASENNFPQAKVSGLAVSGDDLFVSFGSGRSLRSLASIVRFDLNLENPKEIASRLRGCCQRLDMVARDGVLYVAENARHRVVKYDREGKRLGAWGKRNRRSISGFGSCCNPMNLCFDGRGNLITSESGLGRIKKYSIDGKYLGLIGYVGTTRFSNAGRTASACSNIAVVVTNDGKRLFVMDYENNLVRVLVKKKQ